MVREEPSYFGKHLIPLIAASVVVISHQKEQHSQILCSDFMKTPVNTQLRTTDSGS